MHPRPPSPLPPSSPSFFRAFKLHGPAGKKVKLELIKNSAARKATFKRKLGLVKKVSELSILCGVEAMAIVMSPYDPRPEAWLSTQQVQCSLYKFKNPPDLKQKKNMLDQEGHFETEIKKIEDQLRQAADEAAKFKAEQRLMELLSGASVGLDDLTIDELDAMQSVQPGFLKFPI